MPRTELGGDAAFPRRRPTQLRQTFPRRRPLLPRSGRLARDLTHTVRALPASGIGHAAGMQDHSGSQPPRPPAVSAAVGGAPGRCRAILLAARSRLAWPRPLSRCGRPPRLTRGSAAGWTRRPRAAASRRPGDGTGRFSARLMTAPSTRTGGRSSPPGRPAPACRLPAAAPGEICLSRTGTGPGHQRPGTGSRILSALPGEAGRAGQDLVPGVLTVNRRAQARCRRPGLTEAAGHGERGTKVTMRSARHRGQQPARSPRGCGICRCVIAARRASSTGKAGEPGLPRRDRCSLQPARSPLPGTACRPGVYLCTKWDTHSRAPGLAGDRRRAFLSSGQEIRSMPNLVRVFSW